ncbi:MAG: hypothetical protein AAFR53_05565 [Pseudomonadota bacterium]
MSHPWLTLALPCLLAGCVATAPITQPPVTMTFADPARQVSVTGLDTITVRNRLRTDDTTGELAGVPCRLNGPGYTARFVSPATLELPLFGNTAPQLALSCTFEGETKSTTLAARNVSEAARREARQRALEDLAERDGSFVSASIFLDLSSQRRGSNGFDEFEYASTSFTFRR